MNFLSDRRMVSIYSVGMIVAQGQKTITMAMVVSGQPGYPGLP
jgi:hypothetical protein